MLRLISLDIRFKKGLRLALSFFKGVFLSPLENFGRAHFLHDPVIDLLVVASIEKDVGAVVPEREPGVRRYLYTSLWC